MIDTPTPLAHRLAMALEDLVMACELPGEHCEIERALPAARAALELGNNALAGYAVVPRIPTKAMVRAAIDRLVDQDPADGLFYGAVYRAMIAQGENNDGR